MNVVADSTIAALATPPGAGGIGIIRISGSQAEPILRRLFRPSKGSHPLPSRFLAHGWIIDPEHDTPLDEVLAVIMRAPHSYTREDVAEIHCHSNFLVLQQILQATFAAGAHPAAPGEFTKRAFVNGRLDLTQAEAVLELLQARTNKSAALALEQLQGGIAREIKTLQQALIAMLASLEVAIDFPDEAGEILDGAISSDLLQETVMTPLTELIGRAARGKLYRQGSSAVILGRPNVGKSSLLNALLREERAIVCDLPGTTRDIIEEYLDIGGVPLRIIDTAGIHTPTEKVEEIGIQRARSKIDEADIVLLVVDGSRPPTVDDRQLAAAIAGKPALLVINKGDLGQDQAWQDNPFPQLPAVPVSAHTGQGLTALEDRLFQLITAGFSLDDTDTGCAPNLRQQAALASALQSCRMLQQGLDQNLPADLLAVDLQAALAALGDLVGQTTPEDVLDHIFAEFCIGK